MLILCCGPDSYRATQRALELEEAFRVKHDPKGTSIERFESGKGAVEEVIERSLTVSLFSPMRFIRADGLIGFCPKTKTKALANALTKDPERVIVVSIEREKPTSIELKPFAEVPKLLVNEYPLLRGKEFENWVKQAGSSIGVSDQAALVKLARACDGDAWLASNELLKMAAGGSSEVVLEQESNFYYQADAFLRGDKTRYNTLSTDGREKFTYPLFQQSVSGIDRSERAGTFAAASILMRLMSRSGLCDTDEALMLLP
jgi:DNA polymerase III delta subunit